MTQTLQELELAVDEAAVVCNLIIPCANALRGLQGSDGRFVRQLDTARRVLEDLRPSIAKLCNEFGQTELADGLTSDISEWLRNGLDSPPVFDLSRSAYRAPTADGPSFFFGPVRRSDGAGPDDTFIEAFLAWREEGEECKRIRERFSLTEIESHPARMLRASEGLVGGFIFRFAARDIPGGGKVKRGNNGLCFVNKFHRVYNDSILPSVRRLFGPEDALFEGGPWRSGMLSPEECYRVRCVVGYLRQHFAREVRRSADRTPGGFNWYAALLEGLRMDCRAALACMEGGVPYGREAFEFALFERLLQNPPGLEPAVRVSAGAGVFLFEWLYARDAIGVVGEGRLRIDLGAVCDALRTLIDSIDSLGGLAHESAYFAGAEALVRRHLPEGAPRERFTVPDTYRTLANMPPDADLLRFDRLEY